ncbi:MAG: cation:proton antiporter [Gammaproteobacteria bacterium]
MHGIKFIQDLAIIMVIAGITILLFRRFRQPIVLAYILAGVIIGPYTPPFVLISDKNTITIFSELGVIFLMLALGLEFSLKKLLHVGISALVAALLEILLMTWIGYEIGLMFGWRGIDALFLGTMLAISSTTIIIKTLHDLKLHKEDFAQLIFGVLVVEDILAIAILVILTSIGKTNVVNTHDVFITLGKLLLFLSISLSVGILTVPKFLAYVARLNSPEILLIVVLGLCLGFCQLVASLHYSVVLGAFTIGAIIAESRQVLAIERLIGPLRDMFSAIFFVTIGITFDPAILVHYFVPVLVITVAVVVGKVLTCSIGAFVTGQTGKTSLRVGMGLAQIGEFSFIIAALGLSLKVTSNFLYPIVVAVSAITTLLTPYLIKFSDPISEGIKKVLPPSISYVLRLYTTWLQGIQHNRHRSTLTRSVHTILLRIALNLILITTIFIIMMYLETRLFPFLSVSINQWSKSICWTVALLCSLPFLSATYHKLKTLSRLLADFSVREHVAGKFTDPARRIIAEVLPVCGIVVIVGGILLISASILPPLELLVVILTIGLILAIILWKWFIHLYARLQLSFTPKKPPEE